MKKYLDKFYQRGEEKCTTHNTEYAVSLLAVAPPIFCAGVALRANILSVPNIAYVRTLYAILPNK